MNMSAAISMERGAQSVEGELGRDAQANPRDAGATRLSVQTVERLHRLLGGDAHVEGMVLQFIADKYGAKNLFYLPPHVAKEVLKRPADFLRAVKEHCEPELPF
jgi:hypothetical protein